MQTSDITRQLVAALLLGDSHAPSRDFLVIPGNKPRWLMPATADVAGILADWTPYRASSRLKWKAVRILNRVGALSAFPNVSATEIPGLGQVDWRSLGWERRADPIPVIYVGTPGLRQKAVVHLIDKASHTCHAVVKVPLCPGAKDAIVREAGVLLALAEEQYPFAPRLLHLDTARGIAAQQFLPGKSGSRRLRPEYFALLHSLLLPDHQTTLAEQVAFWHEEPLSLFTSKSDLQLMGSALTELADVQSLPACWVHGDFVPWNIRRRTNGPAALIDWEEAESCGLPLQDAFHFLHMQGFLFGERPTAHFEQLAKFAGSLDISPQQCRKLEIAYVARAWVDSAKQNPGRAPHLASTVALLLRQRPNSTAVIARHPGRPRLISSHAVRASRDRGDLFASVLVRLNEAQVPYCVLTGHDPLQAAHGDLDIMFRRRDWRRIPQLLAEAARDAGATLVQAIQHETTACYFVLARQSGRHVAYLDVDCYSDYRRDGREWLTADKLVAARRKHRNFFLPSVPDEFAYYLVKKVLKRSISLHQLKRLRHMFARDPAPAQQRLAALWQPETAFRLQRAIVDENLNWMECQLPNLLHELQRSPATERPVPRVLQKLRETQRLLRRIIFPTGLSLVVTGATSELCSQVADGLVCELDPAFRRTRWISPGKTLPQCFAQLVEVWTARIRSTLVVRTIDESAPADSWLQTLHRFRLRIARRLSPCDLVIQLSHGPEGMRQLKAWRRRVIYIDPKLSPEQMIQEATQAVLPVLSKRIAKRFRLPSLRRKSEKYVVPPAEAGSEQEKTLGRWPKGRLHPNRVFQRFFPQAVQPPCASSEIDTANESTEVLSVGLD